MKASVLKQLRKRQRKLRRRIDKHQGKVRTPMINPPKINYELSDKTIAVSQGGIGMIMEMIKTLQVRKILNQAAPVFKLHAPYDESDHILNIVLNLLSGGTCLEHLEYRRTDEGFLNALGAERIPDPTTAGDFCRRHDGKSILFLMQGINQIRQQVWRQQADDFFEQATIDADGTMVETRGQKKQGIGINYKGQWGYHPLVVSLAETGEVLYLVNRSGNRPSHEHAPYFFNLAIEQCRNAGFRQIRLRGDTDFSCTEHLDQWDAQGVRFILGYDANPTLVQQAESLEESAWKKLDRATAQKLTTRAKRPNYKEQVVIDNGYQNKRLTGESYAEFQYQPGKCSQAYRMIVVRKDIEVTSGQQFLFNTQEYRFYITNEPAEQLGGSQVIRQGNQRCNQENHISQLKACHALAAPLDTLESNWAYMVIASLAWNFKQWSGMLVRVQGNPAQRRSRESLRQRIIKMEFGTYLNSLIQIPAQIIRTARRLKYRLLSYRQGIEDLFTLVEQVSRPLRC